MWSAPSGGRAAATEGASGELPRPPEGSAGRRAGARARSEERRVGKEWRSRWSPYHEQKTEEHVDEGLPAFGVADQLGQPGETEHLAGVFFFQQKTAYELVM